MRAKSVLLLVALCVLAVDVAAAGAGTKKWEFATGGDVWSSPAVSKDGTTIFVGSYDNKVYALDSGLTDWEAIWNLAVSSTSTTPEWGEVKAALRRNYDVVMRAYVYFCITGEAR